MTANDIISSSLIQAQSRPYRFAHKVLSSAELKVAEKEDDLRTSIYLYWGCKEAAYKIDRKKEIKRKLNPKQYLVEIQNNRVEVTSQSSGIRYFGMYKHTTEYLHITLWERGENVRSAILPIPVLNGREQSKDLYEHISKELTDGNHAIEKDERNIPCLTGWDISLSHCGQWAAWSAVKV